LISTSCLRQRLRYEPETGALIWLERPIDDFARERDARAWNARFAGRRAGSINAHGYRSVNFDGHLYRAARLIWQLVIGEPPPRFVDHKNLDRADDRWGNLRLATPKQNGGNMGAHKDGTSGFKGVSKHHAGRWRATLMKQHLGIFDTPEEAHAAYLTAARETYGEFARGA
jgi:HNH endonuclease